MNGEWKGGGGKRREEFKEEEKQVRREKGTREEVREVGKERRILGQHHTTKGK